tara:strand:- start:99 stop:410 length:312 start_codon:yes stop_codon:yes gene_type:complete
MTNQPHQPHQPNQPNRSVSELNDSEVEVYVCGIENGEEVKCSQSSQNGRNGMSIEMEMIEKISEVVVGIRRDENENNFEAKPTAFNCNWCGYKEICEDSVWKR